VALTRSLLRLSVGIEDVDDLWADLDAAIRAGAG
jgi:cystathionine gamma-synthase